ncbi:hypothetical protein Clacol_000980 [Clathrus columnatus]|uniref:Peptidase S53 domain-containing protein n=1 Tax=Clathrus columnatus TaxID=1419009 RepID=A0AAV5A0I0_9AGAM|nr:hypothetical protein Clacol_000980 [Clathrus columnatus]
MFALNINICAFIALQIGITIVLTQSSFASFITHERRDTIPTGFTLIGPADGSSMLTLRINLISNNMPGLESELYNTARKAHLSKEELTAFVSPTNETTTSVTDWLSSFGIDFTTTSSAGNWLQITVNVGTANQLLNANFMSFNDDSTGKEIVRTLSYSLPTQLQPHIRLIHPTVVFPVKVKPFGSTLKQKSDIPGNIAGRATAPPASCAEEITPTCLLDLYGIPLSPTPNPQTASRLAIAEFHNQFPQKADLVAFLKAFRPDLPSNLTFNVEFIDGGSDPQNPSEAGIVANLNVQYTIGLAPTIPVTVIIVGPDNTDGIDGFLDLINFVLEQPNPAQVLLIPFGFNEPDVTSTMAQALCDGYMQLGGLGITVIFPSGNGGVAGVESEQCTTFIPTFPSSCPFVTSVGGTTGIPEVAADFSSGGFSNIFTRPDYQTTAVEKYLSLIGDLNAGKFNKSSRAFPDVSALAENIVIIVGGTEDAVAGTEASATIFASIIALINAEIIAGGLGPVLGFLNPLFYIADIFNDITSGDNPGCDTDGFPALVGWDAISGIGSTNFVGTSSITKL